MSKRLASWFGAGRRAAALWGACGLLAAGGGCGRQTFDLLDPGAAGAGHGGETSASASAGASGALGGADNGSAGLDAGAGRADTSSAGSGGASVDKPCLQREPCADGGLDCSANDCPPGETCSPQSQHCVRGCTSPSDCGCTTTSDCQTLYGHAADVCVFGMCAQCRTDQQCWPEKPYCVGLRCQSKQ